MYPSRRIIFALLLLGSSLLGCSSVGSNLPPLEEGPVAEGAYKLGPGDQLNVTVFGADDLSGEVPVSDTGTAVLPLIGEVKAVGLTPRELEAAIRTKLAGGHCHIKQVEAVFGSNPTRLGHWNRVAWL
jgi:polysaccharide export outer membrane protein